ncbi:MAG TPA: hypothetical protein VFW05_13430 [Verrucomicrobiae bacterium]|nr:hypothetical protein [Verrucomicrobiae bacterium]
MKTPQKLGLIAVVIFVISHFLPAYGEGSGFACFVVCWKILLGRDADVFSGGWFYYSGFVISSVLFIALVAALFTTKKRRGLRSGVSVACLLQVVSWLILNILQHPPEIGEIKVGYYAWLIAYGLLVAAHFWKRPAGALGTIPISPSAISQK